MEAAKNIPVKFGVDMDRLRNILTSDISIEECVFDLVDNSIDAARDKLLKRANIARDRFKLPKSYKGFRIRIKIGSQYVAISDNGSGMSESVLQNESFFTGASSLHPFGLGHYGIGLLRAALKLGKSISLRTDNGRSAYRFDVSEEDLGKISSHSELFATRIPSKGRPSNIIVFHTPSPNFTRSLLASDESKKLAKEISIRYGIFLKKGLSICINGHRCENLFPAISNDKQLFRKKESKKLSNGVIVHADVGYHEKFRFEPNKPTDKNVIRECGWYIVCNDRVIRVADKDNYVKWHPEYNGMLFWAHFISEDPSLMPWDSKKANLNKLSDSFLETQDWFGDIGSDFRSANRSARKSPDEGGVSDGAKPGSSAKNKGRKEKHEAHNEHWDALLPESFPQPSDKKLNALILEAKKIRMADFPYAASLLFRSAVERIVFLFIARTGQLDFLKDHILSAREKSGRKVSDRKNFSKPGLDESLTWLLTHLELFPAASRKDCKKACENFKADLREINGIVHEGKLYNSTKIRNARDNAYPFIEAMMEVLVERR